MRTPRPWLLFVLLLLASDARAQSGEDLRIDVGSGSRVFAAAELGALPQETVKASAHGGPEQSFTGPLLATVLTHAGAKLEGLHGPALAQYVLVEARDDYRVVFAIAELSHEFRNERVILAHSVDGKPIGADQGPWKIIVEGESKPARWVRQVSALRLLQAEN
jgi:hypothetical protein